MMAIFGNLDEYIKLIEKDTNTTIAAKTAKRSSVEKRKV